MDVYDGAEWGVWGESPRSERFEIEGERSGESEEELEEDLVLQMAIMSVLKLLAGGL